MKIRNPIGVSTVMASTSPEWIARNVSSETSNFARSSATSWRRSLSVLSRSGSGGIIGWFCVSRFLGYQAEAEHDFFLVRQVSDHSAQRERKLLYQGGKRDDLLVTDQFGLLVGVDHLQVVIAVQSLLANLLDAGYGLLRAR